ncbi:GTP cyclohydrolase, FolE2/MptA family [Alicyclobacillus fastidiosus]|uniref:GTP cyclohydrolase, FolE2/MptA family n=1 Tax=Alicyclobacillus fastidiosus TaxID=392011 RepID=A0ABV5AHM2_9BACL|nr:GTP cyclohydrolase, FolE2/MptA family [Alicyclobacillus fastidiosus]WEH11521.1 GTP cyclohydrolase, FolE2/MptA family [Alicyclobacillus fastidiosus]
MEKVSLFKPSFYDVPNQESKFQLTLGKVSVFNQKIPVPFEDELFGTVCPNLDVTASVKLHSRQRGIHMSRIEQAFQNLPQNLSIAEVAHLIATRIKNTQEQDEAAIQLSGDLIYQRNTAVSNLPSHNIVTVSSGACVGTANEKVSLGLGATIITACPCMQTYALEELITKLNINTDNPESLITEVPIATHSQKGRVEVIIEGHITDVKYVSLSRIYESLNNSAHLTSELLKRPDEYDMVRRAHTHPQFVEDVVRETIVNVARELENVDPELNITVRAESYESIHGHDIRAEANFTLGDLLDLAKQ